MNITRANVKVGNGTKVHIAFKDEFGRIQYPICGAGQIFYGFKRPSRISITSQEVNCDKCKAIEEGRKVTADEPDFSGYDFNSSKINSNK